MACNHSTIAMGADDVIIHNVTIWLWKQSSYMGLMSVVNISYHY